MLYNKMGEEMYKLTGHDAKESYESGEDFDVAVYIDSLDMEIKTLMEELNGLEDEEEKAGVQEELQMVMETRDSLVRLSSISDLLLQKITKEKFNSAGERLKLHGKVPKDVSLTSDLTLEELEANYVATLESEISKVVPKGMSVDQALATMDKRKAETKILSNNNIMLTAMKTDFSYLGREQSVDKGVEEEVKKIEAEIKEIQEKIKALNEQEKSEERDSEIYNLQVKINVLNNQKQELLNQQHLGPTSNKA